MSQTLALRSFAPAAFAPAPRPDRAAAIRRIIRAGGRRAADLADGVHVYGLIEGVVTVSTLGFTSVVVAAFW